jgi:hypothetical protein
MESPCCGKAIVDMSKNKTIVGRTLACDCGSQFSVIKQTYRKVILKEISA